MGWSKELQENINKLESELTKLLTALNANQSLNDQAHKQACKIIADKISSLNQSKTNFYSDLNLISFNEIKDELNLTYFLSSKNHKIPAQAQAQAQTASDTLNQIIEQMKIEKAAEAKAQDKFLLSEDILNTVFSLPGNASNPTSPQQAPTQIENTIDYTKNEFSYTSQTNPGKVITHNYNTNTVKAEGFDDNLKALLTTLKTLAESRKNLQDKDPLKNPPPLLTFKITEPNTLSTEKLKELLTEIGYKEEHKNLVTIILSKELVDRNDPKAEQAANQAPNNTQTPQVSIKTTTTAKPTKQPSQWSWRNIYPKSKTNKMQPREVELKNMTSKNSP